MRPREDELIDPEIAEQLDAIDATLAGDPVAPRFAELAELALLLAAGRPEGMRPEFGAELDRRVETRFGRDARAGSGSAGGGASAGGRAGSAGGGRWRRWGLVPVLGTAGTALAAAVVAVVVLTSGGGAKTVGYLDAKAVPATVNSSAVSKAPSFGSSDAIAGGLKKGSPQDIHAPSAKAGPPAAVIPAPERTVGPAPERTFTGGHGAGTGTTVIGSGFGAGGSAGTSGSAAPGSAVGSGSSINETISPAPVPNGRKIVQSSTLQLGARASRIDAVAQEVFDVVGTVDGIVDSSTVSSTGGPGASAQFQLRIPSAQLQQALTGLSRLHYASVMSRTDATQDVNSSFVSAQRQIADARAAVARLRVKLAGATLATTIDSLRAQIAGENATIAREQASLRSLNRRVDYSRVQVSVEATTGGGTSSGGGGFGLHKAGHDALRVLEVTAGVALIALAALVPLGLLVALAWWLALTVQRRRRERALDLA